MVKERFQRYLGQPELVGDGPARLAVALLLTAGGLFFFRQRAAPVLAACLLGGCLVLGALWAGFHRLGIRHLGSYWPGAPEGLAVTLLVFCLMPPGVSWLLAALVSALAVAVTAVACRAAVPLAFSGVTAAWLLAWLWQARTGGGYIAPFDLHPLDEPIALWVRFQTAIDPVRTYAGQAAGPLGATSFGLAALGTLLLSYSRKLAWPTVMAFYVPVGALCIVGRLPINVYLFDAPALVFVALIAADPQRLPRTLPWKVVTGFIGGATAAALLVAGSGYQAYGIGVAVSTAVVALFQFFGLAGAPGVIDRHTSAGAGAPSAALPPEPVLGRRTTATQLLALTLFTPAGLVMVWRDGSLDRAQRAALVSMGAVLYATTLAASLLWLWVLRYPA